MLEHPATPIDSLPLEVLELIFGYLYDDFKSSPSERSFEEGLTLPERELIPPNSDEDDLEDIDLDLDFDHMDFLAVHDTIMFTSSLSSLFPYSVAAVCHEWESVLSYTPAFWTRIILPISPTTSLEKTRQYLAWSRNLPVDIFILREYSSNYDKSTERGLVHSFLSFLQPHMKRCRSLHLELKSNSPLPRLSKIIPDHAPLLRALDIHCGVDEDLDIEFGSVDDGEAEMEQVNDHPAASYPRLHFMKLDGRTFSGAMINPPLWFTSQPQLRHVEISTFGAQSSKMSLSSAMRTIKTINRSSSSLSSLSLSSINFEPEDHHLVRALENTYIFDRVQYLYLSEMHPRAISDLFEVCLFPRLEVLNLRDCAGVRPRIFNQLSSIAGMLVLDKFSKTKTHNLSKDLDSASSSAISNPTLNPHADMISLLSNWPGIILSLSTSDTPFDTVFSAVAEPSPERNRFPSKSALLCPNMQTILISACPSPSFAIVKKMIKKRNKRVNYQDPLWRQREYEAPVVTKLEFKFCWPIWTTEEMEWMRSRVADFQWING